MEKQNGQDERNSISISMEDAILRCNSDVLLMLVLLVFRYITNETKRRRGRRPLLPEKS